MRLEVKKLYWMFNHRGSTEEVRNMASDIVRRFPADDA